MGTGDAFRGSKAVGAWI